MYMYIVLHLQVPRYITVVEIISGTYKLQCI